MPEGKSYILASGQSLTNSFVYTGRFTTRNFAKTGVLVEAIQIGSGVQYTMRGFPIEGLTKNISVASGTILTSGDSAYMVLEDPYDQIDVGLKAVQTDRSGVATVYVTGKRK